MNATKRIALNRDGGHGFYTALDGRFQVWPMEKKYLMPQSYGVKDKQSGEFFVAYGLGDVRERIADRLVFEAEKGA